MEKAAVFFVPCSDRFLKRKDNLIVVVCFLHDDFINAVFYSAYFSEVIHFHGDPYY